MTLNDTSAPLPPVFFGRDHTSHHTNNPTHNVPDRHAWVVVGEDTQFLCHLVMGWMQGHNYEAVLEVSLEPDVIDALLEDRANTGATHFLGTRDGSILGRGKGREHTIPDLQAGTLAAFQADLWNYFPLKPASMAWPYPAKTAFLSDVRVTVQRVVHFRQIGANLTAVRNESYLLFGRGREAHLYHTIVDQPDYDHVATLGSKPTWIQDSQLEAGVIVTLPNLPWSATRTQCVDPFRADRNPRVLFHGIERYRNPPHLDAATGTLHPPATKYSEVPELRVNVERSWWFSTRVVNYPGESPCGGLGDVPSPIPHPVTD